MDKDDWHRIMEELDRKARKRWEQMEKEALDFASSREEDLEKLERALFIGIATVLLLCVVLLIVWW